MERLVKSFQARSKEDGSIHHLSVYQKIIDVGTHDNSNAVTLGKNKRIETEDGESVNRLEKGKYQIVQTGIVLLSDSPDAP